MKRHTLVSTVLNSTFAGLAVVAWIQAVGDTVSMIDIASLLGVIAFSLMLVHYLADAIAPKQDDSKDVQYIASRIAVLVAIIAHPVLVNIYLISNGYGLPPESYETFVGSIVPVLLGWAALAAFISFELRGKLQRFEHFIFHANIVAMFLILLHGFLIGMVIMQGWFVWVWWLYLIAFTALAIRRYWLYYQDNLRKWIAIGAVLALAFTAGFYGMRAVTEQSSAPAATTPAPVGTNNKSTNTPRSETTITVAQVASSNGLNGAACWVAVDGTVYDTASSSEWRNGEHVPSNGQARCGQDLSEVIKRSPHGKEVLAKLDVIGKLEQ